MKRTLAILLILLLVLTVTACSQQPQNTEPTYSRTAPTDAEYAADAEFWGDYVKDDSLSLWYQVDSHEVYMDVPNWNFQEFKQTDVLNGGDCIIAITTTDYADFTSLETMHGSVYDLYFTNIQDVVALTASNTSMTEIISIHGMEVYQCCSGTVSTEAETLHTVSYSFVLDGLAINITAVSLDANADAEAIAELDNMTLAIMNSVRDTYEWEFTAP